MRRYRVGIIGCGGRAKGHAEALRKMPEVEIAGAAELDAARLQRFCDHWEIDNRYASAADLLTAQHLDLVTIVTLPDPRPELVVQCAEAGVPAINAEKVAAYSVAAMDRMLQACARAGALLTFNHQMRYLPQFAAVRELVAAGRVGRLLSMRAGCRGSLTEQGPHVMDQMLFLNDESPAAWVLGQCDGRDGYLRAHRAPSSCTASMEFANGVRGTLECGMLAPVVSPESSFWLQKHIEVTGTRGWAGAYVNGGWRALLDSGEALSGPGTWEPNWPAQAELFRRSLHWLEDRTLVHPSRAEVAARGLEALYAVCRSSIDRRAVELPLDRERDAMAELEPLLGPGYRVEA